MSECEYCGRKTCDCPNRSEPATEREKSEIVSRASSAIVDVLKHHLDDAEVLIDDLKRNLDQATYDIAVLKGALIAIINLRAADEQICGIAESALERTKEEK